MEQVFGLGHGDESSNYPHRRVCRRVTQSGSGSLRYPRDVVAVRSGVADGRGCVGA